MCLKQRPRQKTQHKSEEEEALLAFEQFFLGASSDVCDREVTEKEDF
jgi:hypothetical protein